MTKFCHVLGILYLEVANFCTENHSVSWSFQNHNTQFNLYRDTTYHIISCLIHQYCRDIFHTECSMTATGNHQQFTARKRAKRKHDSDDQG